MIENIFSCDDSLKFSVAQHHAMTNAKLSKNLKLRNQELINFKDRMYFKNERHRSNIRNIHRRDIEDMRKAGNRRLSRFLNRHCISKMRHRLRGDACTELIVFLKKRKLSEIKLDRFLEIACAARRSQFVGPEKRRNR